MSEPQEIRKINCEIHPSHEDTFSTQVVIGHSQGQSNYLVRIENVDYKMKQVHVRLTENKRTVGNSLEVQVYVCTPYVVNPIWVAESRLMKE